MKNFMTESELDFYNKIKIFESQYKIIPQINLATIIDRYNNPYGKFKNELYRNIDFAIFTMDYSKVLLLIELNDSTHNDSRRIERDKKVKSICQKAGIELMTFHTKYPNEVNYVVNRINEKLKNIHN